MEAKDSGQVLESKKKLRLRWTKPLHDCFVKAVNQLGGAYEATPSAVVKVLGIKEITTNHIKSYLQKYRLRTEAYKTDYTKAAWNGMISEAIQENERKSNFARHNETSRYIQTSKGKSPVIEGQTNFYNESEVKSPKKIKRQKLQAKEAKTTKHQFYQPATNDRPPTHPSSSWLNLYEPSPTNHMTQTAAVKSDYEYTSVNETENKLQIRQTAIHKSEWLLAATSSEDKGLLSWPSASMRDGIFVGKTMTEHQSFKSSSGLQSDKCTSKESKLATTYELIDLNVSAQDMVQTEKGFYRY